MLSSHLIGGPDRIDGFVNFPPHLARGMSIELLIIASINELVDQLYQHVSHRKKQQLTNRLGIIILLCATLEAYNYELYHYGNDQ